MKLKTVCETFFCKHKAVATKTLTQIDVKRGDETYIGMTFNVCKHHLKTTRR